MTAARSRGTILHRYLGDRRFLLTLPRATALQILHPVIAAATVEHARLRLWEHKRRTVLSMINIAYTDRDLHTVIRFGHEHVKGRDDKGRRYHALNPEVFYFQHATYVESLFTAIDTFARPLTAAEREQLYGECRDWYRRYGISTRYEPATWAEFQDYFAQACATMLRVSPDTEQLRAEVLRPDAWVPKRLPSYAVRTLMHERARELYGVTTSGGDRLATARYAATVRAKMAVAPDLIRYVAQAR